MKLSQKWLRLCPHVHTFLHDCCYKDKYPKLVLFFVLPLPKHVALTSISKVLNTFELSFDLFHLQIFSIFDYLIVLTNMGVFFFFFFLMTGHMRTSLLLEYSCNSVFCIFMFTVLFWKTRFCGQLFHNAEV